MSNFTNGGSDTLGEGRERGSDTKESYTKGTAAQQYDSTAKPGNATGRAIHESIVKNGKPVPNDPRSIVTT
jgi:hypothetical protein